MKLRISHRCTDLTASYSSDVSPRLLSLDALRGFDMMWIIGGEGIIHTLAKATNTPFNNWMSGQLHHTPWDGFTFYDMIFPLFIFIAGVSMPYSFGKQFERSTTEDQRNVKKKIYTSLFRRTIILIICGMVVNGLLQWKGYENTRFASVLGRIALSCFFAAIIFLNFKLRDQFLWFAGLLLGYWALMAWVPVPGYGAGILTPEGNLAGYIDRLLLPGKLHRQIYDPEGLLSTIPAIGTALLGVFTGRFLRMKSETWTLLHKSLLLAAAGVLLIVAGTLLNPVFPINKNLWTSSFVLLAGGWSLLLLFVFYLVIDVMGFKKWSMPFIWIGMNSILIYMASHGLIDFGYTASCLFGGVIRIASPEWQQVWLATGMLLVQLAMLYFLYRKRIFLKV